MRFSPPAMALSFTLLIVSSVSYSQKAGVEIAPRSVVLTQEGKALIAAKKYDEAVGVLETALAVDPRNRPAFLALALVAQRQDLPGKAIRMYREALLLEPNDLDALAGQGNAMVQKGALAKARENLAKIGKLCVTSCAEQIALSAAISKAQAQPVLSAQAVQPKPTITPASETP